MRTQRLIAPVLLGAAAVMIAPISVARAQAAARSPLTVSAELSARRFIEELAPGQLGKFQEYKAVPSGLLLNNLLVRYQPGDGFRQFQLSGQRFGQRDQSVWARATQPGKFDAQLRWDRIPHTFSTTARWIGTQTSRGVYEFLTNPRDTGTLNRAAFGAPVGNNTAPVKLSLAYTPSSAWDTKAEYTHIARRGDRPLGMAFGSPGNNQREVLEPTDHTIRDVKVSQSYTGERFSVMATYNLSLFDNSLESLTADNPLLTADTPTGGSSRGRTSLPPDNLAHTTTATAAVALPMRTRVTATGSYAWWRQNQAFIPATINSAITDPRKDSMPKSLGSEGGTSMMNLMATSRPISSVTITARARAFEFRDDASASFVPIRIVNDRSISPADTSHRDPFTRKNADIRITWRAPLPVSLFAALATERWELANEERNVEHFSEHTPSVGFDLVGNQYVSLRGSYLTSKRRLGPTYNPHTYMPEFRRFDQADRNRTRFGLRASVTPLEQITVAGTWEGGRDEYRNSAYGVQYDRSSMLGGDVDWSATENVSLGGGLTYEDFKNHMSDRYRTPTQIANPTFDWIADNNDVVHTSYASVTAVLVPDKITGTLMFQSSAARFRLMTRNPTTPTGGTASDIVAATAWNLPLVKQLMQQLNTSLTYRVSPDWAATVRFQGELYNQTDFRTDELKPATGAHIFLGNYFQPYNAQYLTVSISYRPQFIRVARSTL